MNKWILYLTLLVILSTNAFAIDFVVGDSGSFDGTGDYVEIDNEGNFDLRDNITLETWMYIEGAPNSYHYILTKPQNLYMIYMAGRGNTRPKCYAAGVSNIISPTALDYNKWYHVVCTFKNGDRTRLYIDGVEVVFNASDSILNEVAGVISAVVGVIGLFSRDADKSSQDSGIR